MFHTVLGPEKFRAGHRPLFRTARRRGGDLRRFREGARGRQRRRPVARSRSGTRRPERRRSERGSTMTRRRQTATLRLDQRVAPTPGQPDKKPMPIPLRTALIGEDSGSEIAPERLDPPRPVRAGSPLRRNPAKRRCCRSIAAFRRRSSFRPRAATASSSGWRKAMTTRSRATRRCRSWRSTPCSAGARGEQVDFEPLIRAARNTLRSNELDPAFKAEAILLPQEAVIAERVANRRSGRHPLRPRAIAGRARQRARGRSGQGAVGSRRRGRRSVAAGEGHAAASLGRAWIARRGRSRTRARSSPRRNSTPPTT